MALALKIRSSRIYRVLLVVTVFLFGCHLVRAEIVEAEEIAAHPVFEKAGELEGYHPRAENAFDGAGNRFVAQRTGATQVWDTQTFQPITGLLKHDGLRWADLTRDGTVVFTAGGKSARLWDVKTSKMMLSTDVATERITLAQISPDGTRFLTQDVATLEKISLWRSSDGHLVKVLTHKDPVLYCRFSPRGTYVATREFNDERPFHVWDARTGIEIGKPMASDYIQESSIAQCADFDEEDRSIIIARHNGFSIFNIGDEKALVEVNWEGRPFDFKGGVYSVKLSPDGKNVFVTARSFTNYSPVYVYDAQTGKLVRTTKHEVIDFEVGRDSGDHLLICQPAKKGGIALPELWDWQSGEILQTFSGMDQANVAISRNTACIGFGLLTKKTVIWRAHKRN